MPKMSLEETLGRRAKKDVTSQETDRLRCDTPSRERGEANESARALLVLRPDANISASSVATAK